MTERMAYLGERWRKSHAKREAARTLMIEAAKRQEDAIRRRSTAPCVRSVVVITCLVVAIGLTASVPTLAAAQFGRGFFRTPPRFPTAESFGHGFNFCRAMYSSVRREGGGQGGRRIIRTPMSTFRFVCLS